MIINFMRPGIEKLQSERIHKKLSHRCAVTEEDYRRIMPKIELLKRLSEVERSIYAVYDMHKQNYLLKSEEQKKLYGFSDENTADEVEVHYDRIHPDDLPFVLETENMVFDFFSQLPPKDKKDYKLVYNFRTRNTEGIYKHYMHQTIILETDKEGKSWLTLVITDLLSDRASEKKPQRRMINMKTGKLHLFHNPDDPSKFGKVLTKRESEILSLIGDGYDSFAIAEKLNISVNTVNNHRQNILRKTGTENTTQALLYCKRLGIIR